MECFHFYPWKDFQTSFPYLIRFLWSRIVNIINAETALLLSQYFFLSRVNIHTQRHNYTTTYRHTDRDTHTDIHGNPFAARKQSTATSANITLRDTV